MKSFILIVCFLAMVSADPDFKTFFSKFAAVKMFSDCFGEDYMSAWTQNFSMALAFCNQQEPDTYLRDLPLDEFDPTGGPPFYNEYNAGVDNDEDLNNGNILPYLQQTYVPNNLPAGFANPSPNPIRSGVYNLPRILTALQGNLSHPILLVPLPYPIMQGIAAPQGGRFYRQKRQAPMINEEVINSVYQRIRNKAGNFTCIMKRLDFFDENLDVNVGYQMSQITDIDVDAELKADIFESMTDCIRFASCKPLDRRSLMPPAVQRAISFMKCENKMNLAACVKHDLIKKQDKFDVKALERIPAGSDMDLGDRMLAILWGKFSRKH